MALDFLRIKKKNIRKGVLELSPEFIVNSTKDLMVRGKTFYAIWDDSRGLWSTDEMDVQRLVDYELDLERKKEEATFDGTVTVRWMHLFSSQSWTTWRKFVSSFVDNYTLLDGHLVFADATPKRTDYASRRLPYILGPGSKDSYEELMTTLFDPEERQKLEWAVGSIFAGESKKLQKFVVLYGDAGSGKSTFLNIIQSLFDGYYSLFDAKALTSASNNFALDVFRSNPLVVIQHDGDLSRIEDNTKLNSIVSHEEMIVNEKFKAPYVLRPISFLFLGTNNDVRITNARSGLLRRLIDVQPSGRRLQVDRYYTVVGQIGFELGAIAQHCLDVFRSLGKNYYANYRPTAMVLRTDVFYNYVEHMYSEFLRNDYAIWADAYNAYKAYCAEANVEFKLPKHKFRTELMAYFHFYHDQARVGNERGRGVFKGFKSYLFDGFVPTISQPTNISLTLEETESLLDRFMASLPAQYATKDERPEKAWDSIITTLSDLDTSRLHYVRPQLQHIVIDFDIKDKKGKKSLELNLLAASQWPPTYAELSKSGQGIHLHYLYEGDVESLSRIYEEGIEIKVFVGKASLRRKLTKCNNIPIATLSSGLPFREAKMLDLDSVRSERALRDLITRNLRKEIHAGTKPSIDFIHKILEDAYKSGLHYDITDMRPHILAFANNSTNQAEYCVKLVSRMKFASEEQKNNSEVFGEQPIVFFDVEVFPNLLVVCWKVQGKGKEVMSMINPSAHEIGELLKFRLVGFNCRRYDNHILYARYVGYEINEIYQLSQKIISESRNSMFGEAYNLSYTDIYDFSSKKQSLKKFQIELGIHHQELGLKWDQDVPEELWMKVVEYCKNDVIATEAVFDARHADFVARQILADIAGMTVNDTTQMLTAKIIFGNDKRPQDQFKYVDLSEMFPGYRFENGQSTYKGEITGEGGYVYAEPGMYTDVAVLDVVSMHPTSLVAMDHFGPYTERFKQLLEARVAIKRKQYTQARGMLGGVLAKYLESDEDSATLSYALKIVINIVYGLTSAKFDNKFRDPRNNDNIVAKRGALFMIDLKEAVQAQGFQVIHIKTDSIKIPNASSEIIQFVFEFGARYGYEFEHETTYSRFCLVNDAVYIALTSDGKWDATGAQFAQSYVFKTLFSKDIITFDDLYEVKNVTTAIYLDFNESLPEGEHNYHFVGKAGAFCPILPGKGGATMLRESSEGKYGAVVGTKGYRWMEAEVVAAEDRYDDIDRSYYISLVDEAVKTISKFGDFEWFVSE